MAVKEQIHTKRDCYTVMEDGQIIHTRGKFTPDKPVFHGLIELPERPKTSGGYYVQFNIWGEEISRQAVNERAWLFECDRINWQNEQEKARQTREFKKHLLEVKKECHMQEARAKQLAKIKERKLKKTQKDSARAWLLRQVSNRNGCINY